MNKLDPRRSQSGNAMRLCKLPSSFIRLMWAAKKKWNVSASDKALKYRTQFQGFGSHLFLEQKLGPLWDLALPNFTMAFLYNQSKARWNPTSFLQVAEFGACCHPLDDTEFVTLLTRVTNGLRLSTAFHSEMNDSSTGKKKRITPGLILGIITRLELNAKASN